VNYEYLLDEFVIAEKMQIIKRYYYYY